MDSSFPVIEPRPRSARARARFCSSAVSRPVGNCSLSFPVVFVCSVCSRCHRPALRTGAAGGRSLPGPRPLRGRLVRRGLLLVLLSCSSSCSSSSAWSAGAAPRGGVGTRSDSARSCSFELNESICLLVAAMAAALPTSINSVRNRLVISSNWGDVPRLLTPCFSSPPSPFRRSRVTPAATRAAAKRSLWCRAEDSAIPRLRPAPTRPCWPWRRSLPLGFATDVRQPVHGCPRRG